MAMTSIERADRVRYLITIRHQYGDTASDMPLQPIIDIFNSDSDIFEVFLPSEDSMNFMTDEQEWAENYASYFDMNYDYPRDGRKASAVFRFTDLSDAVEFKLRWL